MKQVKITRIRMLNFKGMRELEVRFNTDGATRISGRNGSGKTTIFDAFTWALFGKDSLDRKQFDIKTLDAEGRVIPRLPHEVEVSLLVDGQPVTLLRRYSEKWTKKRGSAIEEFAGHEEERLYNDVPCSLRDWNEKIAAICPEQVFKFITNPACFTSQKWEVQRAMLIRMAGGVSDEEVAAGNADFAKLLADMTGKTTEEYKREIGAKKKRIKSEIDAIPGRIDERRRDIREDVDFAAIRAELNDKLAAIANIDNQLADLSKGLQDAAAARQSILQDREAITMRISRLEMDITEDIERDARRARKEREDMADKLAGLNAQRNKLTAAADDARAEIEQMKQRREMLIAEYRAIMAETLDLAAAGMTCPTCGRPFELDEIDRRQREMQARFNESKAQRIAANKGRGAAVSRDKIAAKEADLKRIEETIALVAASADDLAAKLQATAEPLMPNPRPTIEANAEWRQLKEEEARLAAELARPITDAPGDTDRAELVDTKHVLQEAVSTLQRELAAEATNAANAKRIAELENDLRNLSVELAELEGIEFQIAAFTKARIEAVEAKINALFQSVRFRMYDTQINGGEVEKCEAVIDGVPYSSANNAARINAGLDIINAICRFEGIAAPLFIDNAEGVNKLLPTTSQQIHLIVTEDPHLLVG